MKFSGNTAWMLGAALALVFCAGTATADDKIDVKVILDRNPFALKPPPPPVVQTNEPPKGPETVKLSGIVSIIGPPRALLVRQEAGQQKPDYLSLREGEKDGAVEVVRIDVDAGEVEITNGGIKKILDFKNDGLKPATPAANPAMAAAIPGGGPGGQQNSTGGFAPPQPGGAPAWSPATKGTIPAGAVPTLTPSSPAAPAGGVAPGTDGLYPNPTRQMRVPTTPQANAVLPPAPVIDRDAQVVQIEVNRVATQDDVARGLLPPLPPTPLTPEAPAPPAVPK